MIKSLRSECAVALLVEKSWKAQYAMLADQGAGLVFSQRGSIDQRANALAISKMECLRSDIHNEADRLAADIMSDDAIALWVCFLESVKKIYLDQAVFEGPFSMEEEIAGYSESVVMGSRLMVCALERMLTDISASSVRVGEVQSLESPVSRHIA